MRNIDKLKTILESQVKEPNEYALNWNPVNPHLEPSPDGERLSIICEADQVGFAFDSKGKKFLGIFSWKVDSHESS